MPKKILIPLDGSELGEAALRYVEELIITLSAEEKVEITLIQILSPSTRSKATGDGTFEIPLNEEEIEPIKKEALDYLDQAGESLRNKGATVKCKVVVSKTGASSAEEIIKAEDAINADLVAMSTHGRRGLSRWVYGSVTEKVLQAGKVPVLVVRAGKKT
jgi:nucleotide-binding universal stress UspA family protein